MKTDERETWQAVYELLTRARELIRLKGVGNAIFGLMLDQLINSVEVKISERAK